MMRRNNKSGALGVFWNKGWVAQITADKEKIYLGRFKNKEDAVAARRSAEKQYGAKMKKCGRHRKHKTEEERLIAIRKSVNESYKRRRDEDPIKFFLSRAKSRASEKKLDFNLTSEDINIPDICPVLGVPLAFKEEKRSPNSASLDRIIPEKGYTKGNVAIISWRANTLKRDCVDPEELRKVANYIEQNIKERKNFEFDSK